MNRSATHCRQPSLVESFAQAKLRWLSITLAVIAGVFQAAAQGVGFFRISGPAPARILSFSQDGTMVWSNAQSDATYTIQTTLTLLAGTNWVDYVRIPPTNAVHTNLLVAFHPPAGMAFVPAGVFTMGNSIGDSDITNANPTNVYVSAIYMDANLIGYGEWQAVYDWATNHGYSFDNEGSGKASNHPVQTVNWYDCVKWCNARSQQAGLTPVYYTDVTLTRIYTNADVDAVFANWPASGYRLPTEAEWEKAARGGLNGRRFPWGDTISESQATYFGDTNDYGYDLGPNGLNSAFDTGAYPYTSPLGSFAPNGYGLHDMAGNIWEWCWDWYGAPQFPFGSPYVGGTDPRGPASGVRRVLRGGWWNHDARYLRCADRFYDYPNSDTSFYGFRCVKGL